MRKTRKKICLCGIGLLMVGALASVGTVSASNTEMMSETQKESELFPDKSIEDVKEGENLYVDLNNKFVEALSDYEEGRISAKEYENICKEIQNKIKTEGLDEVQEAEEEYKEQIEE